MAVLEAVTGTHGRGMRSGILTQRQEIKQMQSQAGQWDSSNPINYRCVMEPFLSVISHGRFKEEEPLLFEVKTSHFKEE